MQDVAIAANRQMERYPKREREARARVNLRSTYITRADRPHGARFRRTSWLYPALGAAFRQPAKCATPEAGDMTKDPAFDRAAATNGA